MSAFSTYLKKKKKALGAVVELMKWLQHEEQVVSFVSEAWSVTSAAPASSFPKSLVLTHKKMC